MPKERDDNRIDVAALRDRLAGASGQQFWRGLEELAGTAEFQDLLRHEFPGGADLWQTSLSRRSFLKLMGASLALASLTGCGRPREQIVPYVEQPEEIVPGKPLFYATALTLCGYATGVLVESHEGRPTKIEGNPRHPASLGASGAFEQAAILGLYDPDRSQAVINIGRISTWDAFLAQLTTQLQAVAASQGAGLRLLTEPVTSPTLASQIQSLLQKYPRAQWHQWAAVNRDSVFEGARLAFGRPANPVYRIDQAEIILALDADFLGSGPGCLRYARQFADRRRVRAGQERMNRLYAVESMPTVSGAIADHRLRLKASHVETFARALAARLGIGIQGSGRNGAADSQLSIPISWLDALVKDLQANRGRSLIIAGVEQPPAVHALAHALNAALGNIGQTAIYTEPVEASPVNTSQSLRALVDAMNSGQVSALVLAGGNPVFDAPADLDFASALAKVDFRVHLGLYEDETAALCHWHIPAAHELESWGDARAFDGSASVVQPLIMPLYGGKSAYELLAALQGQVGGSDHDLVRGYWKEHGLADDHVWRQALHDGVIANSAFSPIDLAIGDAALSKESGNPQSSTSQGLEIVFRPDPTIWDGRFANSGWLQELPKPITTLTWDNAAFMSPATAARLELVNEDLIELRFRGRSARAPVWVLPGHADDSITVTLGYGRTRAGRVGTNTGFNAYPLRASDALWFGDGLEVVKAGERYAMAATQIHFNVEGRDLVKAGMLAEFEQNPKLFGVPAGAIPGQGQPSLLPEYSYNGHRWGMSIDTSVCIGCNACTIACQAENNIPVVGKEQVLLSREMHWLKVDRYYEGGLDNPRSVFQPRPCMQCEQAPCELVCPVGATVHSAEGLNDMVYNRCVGTRYCSNNCPYKVRHFNFFQYADQTTPVIKLMQNPDVTVRDRGVMEKCTYCVQRINAAKIAAEHAGRPIQDGEIKTACQEACPTQAIVFGDINDQQSQVAQLKAQPTNYGLLAELGTRPRTTYLAKLRNPNPEISAES